MYKVVLSLAFLITAVLINYNDESTGLEMKTYSYQYASEVRELRRGGGGSRGGGYSGSSGRTTTYSSYNPNAGRVYRGSNGVAYKIEYIPTAFKYEYAI